MCIYCKTEIEAKDFCKKAHEHGYKWGSGDSLLTKTHFYSKGVWYMSPTNRIIVISDSDSKTIDIKWENYINNDNRLFKSIKTFQLEALEGLEVTLHTVKENNYEVLFGHDKKNDKVYMLSEVYRIDSKEVN